VIWSKLTDEFTGYAPGPNMLFRVIGFARFVRLNASKSLDLQVAAAAKHANDSHVDREEVAAMFRSRSLSCLRVALG
jgi:hypothetical protein